MPFNETGYIQEQCAAAQIKITSISDMIDQLLYHPTKSNPSDVLAHIDSVLVLFEACGDDIEAIEEDVSTLASILNQPEHLDGSQTGFVYLDDSLDHSSGGSSYQQLQRSERDRQLIQAALDCIIRQYDRLEAKIESELPPVQYHYTNLDRVNRLAVQNPGLYMTPATPNTPSIALPQQLRNQPISQPNLVSLLQLPSLQTPLSAPLTPLSADINPTSTTDSSIPVDLSITNTHRAGSLRPTSASSASGQTTHSRPKKAFTSTVMQQQILESLQRSRESLGENLQKTQDAYDTFVMSSEILTLINDDASTAKENSKLSASLTRQHEQKAIMEKYMVRWSFIFVLSVAVWVIVRRVLWFATPLIYILKPIFFLLGILRMIIVWVFMMLWPFGGGDVMIEGVMNQVSGSINEVAEHLGDHVSHFRPMVKDIMMPVLNSALGEAAANAAVGHGPFMSAVGGGVGP